MREWKEVVFQNKDENNDNVNIYPPLQYANNILSVLYIIMFNFSSTTSGELIDFFWKWESW